MIYVKQRNQVFNKYLQNQNNYNDPVLRPELMNTWNGSIQVS